MPATGQPGRQIYPDSTAMKGIGWCSIRTRWVMEVSAPAGIWICARLNNAGLRFFDSALSPIHLCEDAGAAAACSEFPVCASEICFGGGISE